MRESKIEQYLKREIENLGGMCLKWESPGQRGVPDRICILPGGKIFFVELKSDVGGKVSGMQKYMHKKLTHLGCDVFLLTGTPMVSKLIDKIKLERGETCHD